MVEDVESEGQQKGNRSGDCMSRTRDLSQTRLEYAKRTLYQLS